MQHLRRAFPNMAQRTLLARKGVYPYDYMDSMDRFNETSNEEADITFKFGWDHVDLRVLTPDRLHQQMGIIARRF